MLSTHYGRRLANTCGVLGTTLLLSVCALTGCSSAPSLDTATPANPSAAESDSAATMSVTDVAGRTVDIPAHPERILLAEGRGMFVTSMLNTDNPTEHIVGVGTDLHSAAPGFEEKLATAAPDYNDLPQVGNIAKGDVSVENLLSLNPDVVVMTLDHKKAAEESGFLTKMDQAGLTYVFTDFRQKPLVNTPKSMTLFGQLLGKEDKAQEFNDFYTHRVEDISRRAAALENKPNTFVWRAAGLQDCCSTVKESNLGDLVTAAGGTNMGDELLTTESGTVTAEKLLSVQPEHIIATGGAWAPKQDKPEQVPHVDLGYSAHQDTTTSTLLGLLNTPGLGSLTAPEHGNLHAVYHQFYDSPFNVFALEQFAQWIHPEEFSDLHPVEDFAEFHKNWLPFDFSGVFFASATS